MLGQEEGEWPLGRGGRARRGVEISETSGDLFPTCCSFQISSGCDSPVKADTGF